MSCNALNDVVVVGMARTPIGNFQGALSAVSALDLAEVSARAAIERSGLKPEYIEAVNMGVVLKQGLGGNPARQLQLRLGLPKEGGAVTIDQQCVSSMKALEVSAHQIMVGQVDAILVSGMESMSNVPYLLMDARKGLRMGDSSVLDAMQKDALTCAIYGHSMMGTAENVAEKYGITREEQDKIAAQSYERALKAIANGTFKEEIVPVEVKTRKGTVVIDTDERPKPTSFETLQGMKPAFKKDGSVTAGNASGVNDGACAAVIMSAKKAEELGIKPLMKILAAESFGVEPEVMGEGPLFAIPKAVKKAGLKVEDINYFEINEAFAAQVAPCIKGLNIPSDKVNANGSGIALGHPVGMTGLRIIIAAYYELKRRNEKYGCASLCAGGGPAMATVVERLN